MTDEQQAKELRRLDNIADQLRASLRSVETARRLVSGQFSDQTGKEKLPNDANIYQKA